MHDAAPRYGGRMMRAAAGPMTRTIYAPDQPPSFLARWASRIAIFCAVVLPITAFLHRVFSLSTPIALNLALASFAGAALVLVMAAIAGLDIWVTGRQGAARVVVATVVAAAILTLPASLYIASRKFPMLNDVTTDVAAPPSLADAAKRRPAGANSTDYPGAKFAKLQQASYPDLKTLVVPRPAEETFELVLQAAAKLKMRPTYLVPPDEEPGAPGIVEIIDKTMVFGFADDIVIRIASDDLQSRVDVRSASRYGRSDFGRNAERVRAILREIIGRLEASVPNPEAAARAQKKLDAKTAAARRPRAGDPASAERPSKQGPSRSGTRREPARKASPQE